MSNEMVPTWVYGPKGESRLIDLPAGATAPKGWAFEPPAGIELEKEAPQPVDPAFLNTNPTERTAALEKRVDELEAKVTELAQLLDDMTAPDDPPADDKTVLLARAKDLNIEGVDGRTGVEKLKAAIADAEAKAKPE